MSAETGYPETSNQGNVVQLGVATGHGGVETGWHSGAIAVVNVQDLDRES